MIAIIDYDAGNLKSVEKALTSLSKQPVITRDPQVILRADKLILPGVGSFGDAMKRLHQYELVDVIHQAFEKRIPLLGICLGMQLLFERSEESPGVPGLGLLEGSLVRFQDTPGLKVPHMGWNRLNMKAGTKLLKGMENGAYVYFVHSYYLKAKEETVVAATAQYGVSIHAAVESGNLFGCQFHPEKSSDVGLTILKNFMELPEEVLSAD